MTQHPKRRLGRGLAALIGEDVSEDDLFEDARNLRQIPIEHIRPNPNNPRKYFGDEELNDLAESIKDKGLLQPILVRPIDDGQFEIIAGERRWRAAQRAQVHELPVLIRDLSDGEALEIALIENIQRSDLNPLEEAKAYAQLIDQFTYTQQQLADSIGKSRSHIANTLRLLNLPEPVRRHIEDGRLTAGHARALVATDSPGQLAERIIALGLSVRETEELTREKPAKSPTDKTATAKNPDIRALEKQLGESLGLKVEINDKGSGAGQMVIRYSSLDQLDEVCRRLSRSSQSSAA
jgi:ParB family chromosome partitioning protein